ncbi:MAG TPA: DUF4350 domain-containing protein [Candidatus Lumbricidophila sp.]|nr:DUF4350 domain-containing protein [Candidatus Lumbricidophila sp.]
MSALAPTSAGASARAETYAPKRGRAFWIALAIVLVLGAIGSMVLSGRGLQSNRQLDPTSAAPNGAKALAQVLVDHGVRVRVESTLDAAVAATNADATVFWFDDAGLTTPEAAAKLAGLAGRSVVVRPGLSVLDRLAPGVHQAGAIGAAPGASCAFHPATQAGELSPGLLGYRIDDHAAAAGWSGCFVHDDRAALAVHGTGDLIVVASPELFQNDTIGLDGNAALVLGLLGSTSTVVWYLPPVAEFGGAPTVGELTPGWLTPLLTLGAAIVVAVGFWRGRRFGPLVFENLPVLVPAAESSVGRARLYARNATRVHALDQLRLGMIGRASAMLRVPREAGVSDVVRAIANTLGRPATEIAWILVDFEPSTDRELMQATERLTTLEAQVRAATGSALHHSTATPTEGPTP